MPSYLPLPGRWPTTTPSASCTGLSLNSTPLRPRVTGALARCSISPSPPAAVTAFNLACSAVWLTTRVCSTACSCGQSAACTTLCNCAARCVKLPPAFGNSNTMYFNCCHSASSGCARRTAPDSASNVPCPIHNSPSSAVAGSLAINQAGAATVRPLRKRSVLPSHNARTPSYFSLTQ